ncbi:MAG: hypothetical protein A2V90_07290 [Gammaproteobacteria bacterium RBG_16_57_12]|nr:MAG: hypothetical protein A2V90_07290 [Gammaproteobacteria bacterium RBG_16_57_12]
MGVYAVDKLMQEARRLAAEYRRATGQPLGISGEIAEYDAARLLGLEIIKDPSLGYDAVGHGAHEGRRIQIKGRVIFDERKQAHRLGQLNLDREWDSVILVLMDEDYQPVEIHEAQRQDIEVALAEPASSKRNKRGAMSVAKFKIIGRMIWNNVEGEVPDDIWDNQAQT